MIYSFISLRFLDVIDIVLVAFLLYQLYMLIRGTVAIRIFIGIFSIYLFWLVVKALNMELLGSILGQVIGVGVIAMLIVFQQEIRRFLLMLGNRYFSGKRIPILRLFGKQSHISKTHIEKLVKACEYLSDNYTGALIVISKTSDLRSFTGTGEILNADISERLIQNIFYENSPLHDGAIIIAEEKIKAAGCVLPVSENPQIPDKYGLRHRAAIGMTEVSDSIVIVVSEQRGSITIARNGKIYPVTSVERLKQILSKDGG